MTSESPGLSFIQGFGILNGDKMEVVVVGNKGMLGHMVEKHLSRQPKFSVRGFGRETLEITPNTYSSFATKLTRHVGLTADYVINCVGAIKPHFNNKSAIATNIFTNAIFPHFLSQWGQETGTKVIHITTDCVFDGKQGKYTEISPHTALDAYGKSKSIGEPETCMVIRTSIIGPEVGTKKSLLEWVLSRGVEGCVNGFTNHLWNGLTTLELARSLHQIMDRDLYSLGTYHLFSNDISKYDLVSEISKNYGLNLHVNPVEAEPCDRTLRTVKSLNFSLDIPTIERQINELKKYE